MLPVTLTAIMRPMRSADISSTREVFPLLLMPWRAGSSEQVLDIVAG